MKRVPKFLRVLIPLLIAVTLLFTLLNVLLVDFVVEALWYQSLGYLRFMFLKIGYKYVVLFGVTFVFFFILFLNFWVASRYLGVTTFKKETRVKKLIQGFRSGSMKVYTPLALILAVVLALPIYREWESALLLFFAPRMGSVDAFFKLDVSFYLFGLPLLRLVYGRVLLTLVVMLLSLTVLYAAEIKVLSKEGQSLYRGAKFHLSLVVALIFLVIAGAYGIAALMLQYTTSNLDLFYGPGFAEYYYKLPLLGLAAFMMLPLALSLILLIWRQKGLKTVILFLILAMGTHLFQSNRAFYRNINTYLVKPDELAKQSPFIQQSIQSTLSAYQLQNVDRRTFEQEDTTKPFALAGGLDQLENIPLWDIELLEDVYQQLQAIRPYYKFSGVDVARYMINGHLQQVYLSAREISIDQLPGNAKRWVNERMKYTHGYGLVMTPAAQEGESRMRWYIHNMPPESKTGFSVDKPAIYYGLEDLQYVVSPNESGEFHHPGDEESGTVTTQYEGQGGVPVSGFMRRMLFGLYFKDRNLFLPNQIIDSSRIHFRRNIVERIQTLTPFFQLDDDPYLVVTEDRLYWMVDAYTTSRWYPNAQPFNDDLNYIRNSIKIVVDAYEGNVSYYLADKTDPIGRAYQRMYPGLISDLEEMPPELKAQIRYPSNLFEIQMRMYAKYHQEDPETFYQSEDLLQFAEFNHQDTMIQMRPYYITLDLVEPGKREFLLLTPLLPFERDNLRALGVVRSDGEAYGDIVFYTFPKGSQVYGPPQINALIDQNTEIAQSITLWNQQGSEVKRGKMIILPIDGRIIYIQPFYMEASGTLRIPQLKRVIVCVDEKVAMDVSIEKAMRKIHAQLTDDDSPLFENLEITEEILLNTDE